MELSIPVPVPELPNVIPAHPCLTDIDTNISEEDIIVGPGDNVDAMLTTMRIIASKHA